MCQHHNFFLFSEQSKLIICKYKIIDYNYKSRFFFNYRECNFKNYSSFNRTFLRLYTTKNAPYLQQLKININFNLLFLSILLILYFSKIKIKINIKFFNFLYN
uniref:Putative ovule protein n=1 Tax=Solanum chacoense TaxID=4108 RepID=A0A0V0IX38_SOLCH